MNTTDRGGVAATDEQSLDALLDMLREERMRVANQMARLVQPRADHGWLCDCGPCDQDRLDELGVWE